MEFIPSEELNNVKRKGPNIDPRGIPVDKLCELDMAPSLQDVPDSIVELKQVLDRVMTKRICCVSVQIFTIWSICSPSYGQITINTNYTVKTKVHITMNKRHNN